LFSSVYGIRAYYGIAGAEFNFGPPFVDSYRQCGCVTMQTVLVVDDEDAVRYVVTKMLKQLGYEVLTAADGGEAVEIFSRQPEEIDCVIVDLAMPDMDGLQTFLALRQIRPDACILLASGFDEEEVAQQHTGQGFAGFIQKPFSAATLEQKLNEAPPSESGVRTP
jgi:two-component system cell cycle sensor histidine kinase/response regulator CckA